MLLVLCGFRPSSGDVLYALSSLRMIDEIELRSGLIVLIAMFY